MKVEPIKVINVDDVPLAIDSLSDTVKNLVVVYDEWRQEEADARNRLMMVQAAMRDISREIILTIRKDQETDEAANDATEAEAPAEAAADVQEANPDEATDPA